MFNTSYKSTPLRSSALSQHVGHHNDSSASLHSLSDLSLSEDGLYDNGKDEANNADSSMTKIAQRPSLLENDEETPTAAAAAATAITTSSSSSTSPLSAATSSRSTSKPKDTPVTWSSLPHKGQLAILTLARLSEPLAERSLAAYMFYQLRSFDPNLPDSTITSQGGMLTAAFAAAQFFTAVWWGRAADTPWIGRKRVLLVGLFGTALASIGVGFSKTFVQALCFRALAGALNGNIGVMRTMISEIVLEKKYQSRAFLLMPMCFNIGVIIGPILGGFLADPIASFPQVFGPGSLIGGGDGVAWMKVFPYGLPNLFSGVFIMMSALGVILGLDETHHALRNKPDYGRKLGRWLVRAICRRRHSSYAYTQVSTNEADADVDDTSIALRTQPKPTDIEQSTSLPSLPIEPKPKPKSVGIRSILTHNILLTLSAHHLLALHISTFNALIFLFLPSPRSPPPSHPTLRFTGGLGLSSSKVGLATAIIGLIGFPLQIFIYPSLNAKLGTLNGYRYFLPFSALAYTTLPFLVLLPREKPVLVWGCLTLVLAAQVLSRTFALTSTVILINNSSPGPEVLGTIHGVAQSVSSLARMIGPTVGGWGLGVGLSANCVGAVWWAMAVLVAINWGLLCCIYEGDGSGGKV